MMSRAFCSIEVHDGMAPMNISSLLPSSELPITQHPKLIERTDHESEPLDNSRKLWKPNVIKHRDMIYHILGPIYQEEAITQEVLKKTMGILNKLTPLSVTKLSKKFLNILLEGKEETINRVVKVVFERAIDYEPFEPSYVAEYARMLSIASDALQLQSPQSFRKFRKLILDQCQQEFHNSLAEKYQIKELEMQMTMLAVNKEQVKTESEENTSIRRKRSIGNVSFIGELFNVNMITPSIMVECVSVLLELPDDENLECLCILLTTVGAKLDEQLREIDEKFQLKEAHASGSDTVELTLPKFIPEEKWMTKMMEVLKHLSDNKNKTLSIRIRFALLNLVELKENNWIPRRAPTQNKLYYSVTLARCKKRFRNTTRLQNLGPKNIRDLPQGQITSDSNRDLSFVTTGKKDSQTTGNKKSKKCLTRQLDKEGGLPVVPQTTLTFFKRNIFHLGERRPSQTSQLSLNHPPSPH